MAEFNYHNGKDQVVVRQLDALQLNLTRRVPKSSSFNVRQLSSESRGSAKMDSLQYNNYIKIANAMPAQANNKSKKALEFDRVINEINDGYKVLIILRGLPGSGKSTLAKSLLGNTIGHSPETARNHILSADDYFKRNGAYQYDPTKISEAHDFTHRRAFSSLSKGYSPVIIDNTNTEMWEMKPYAGMATDYGYILEILEPDTHWCFNERELAKRNTHGVPKPKIRNMLDRYQKNVTPLKLLTAYGFKYSLQRPPQYRLHPPLTVTNAKTNTTLLKSTSENILKIDRFPGTFNQRNANKESTNFMEFCEPTPNYSDNPFEAKSIQSSSVDDILMHREPLIRAPILKPEHITKSNGLNAWGIDEASLRSWDIVTPIEENEMDRIANSPIVVDSDEDNVEKAEMCTSTEDDDFHILRNIVDFPPPLAYKVITTCNRDINRNMPFQFRNLIRQKCMIDKSCSTDELFEDQALHLENLAKIFPNLDSAIIRYWFNKCNMDFDCTMELLLAERDDIINVIVDKDSMENDNNIAEPISLDSDSNSSTSEPPAASHGAKSKRRNNSPPSDESRNLKRCIEEKITISDDHYSEKLLKIKQRRDGYLPQPTLEPELSKPDPPKPESPQPSITPEASSPLPMDTDDNKLLFDDIEWEDPSPKTEPNEQVEMIELNLGSHFVSQLENKFGDPNLMYPKGFQPVVQMPVSLARQLYAFYIESVFQQMEAQNSIMDDLVKEDEEFARKLHETDLHDTIKQEANRTSEEPTEIPDIMKEQRVLSKWEKEADKWKDDNPDTLAFKLTKDKLFSAFPSVDKDTLLEILHAHDNVYKDTVESLLASTNAEGFNGDIDSIKDPPLNATTITEMWEDQNNCKKVEVDEENACAAIDYREEANKYLQKRTKLYEKAQRYHQSGMNEVAQFYSRLASDQTKYYEHANSLAATAFLDEHSKRLEDFNALDLHFLYVKEAIPHLDIFLDRNIRLLQLSTSKKMECLQIITGRGKNSKNGVSRLRPAVIARLNERKIRYQQLNPGLIKIKITQNSKLTSEL